MFRPSGVSPMTVTSNPSFETALAPPSSSRRSRMSMAILKRPSRDGFGKRLQGVLDVGIDDIGVFHRRHPARRHLPAPVGDDRFHVALQRLGELLAAAGKHLDAVVFERIVRGADHDARVETHRARHVGCRRRRDHARAGDRGPLRMHAAPKLAFDPVARFTRVAPDDEAQRASTRPSNAMARTSAAPSRATVS